MSIFDLINKKFVINCTTEEDARSVVDTAINYGLATNWDEGEDTRAGSCGYNICYMFEWCSERGRNEMYFSGKEWPKTHGYAFLIPEDIDEIKELTEEVNPSSFDVFAILV